MRHIYASACDSGRLRQLNEDAVLVERLADGRLLAALADGMGGLAHGEIASHTAIQTLFRYLNGARSYEDAPTALARAFAAANSAVNARAAPAQRMGSTLVAGLVDNDTLHVASVGDSRAYLIDGAAHRLTEDHTLAQEQLRAGLVTIEEASRGRFRNMLTRSLGARTQAPQVDVVGPFLVADGSAMLLCSDGLYSMVADDELAPVASRREPPEAVAALVELANERGGPDNISAVIVAFHNTR